MTKKFTKIEALLSLRPGACWSIVDDVFTWMDEVQTQPSEKEINEEIKRLQGEYEYASYQRERSSEYPSVQEQLDTLFHGGFVAWKEQIQAVKDKYPKPE